jgi:hypothetical protein
MQIENRKEGDPSGDETKVSVTLTRGQIVALDKLVCRIRDSGGRKLPLNAVLRAAVKLFLELHVDSAGCRDENDLLAALRKTVRKRR